MGKDREMHQTPPSTVRDRKHGGRYLGAQQASPTREQKYPDEVVPDRPFKDLHHPLIKAIWSVDRFQPDVNEKLKELRQLVVKNGMNASVLCDILHDFTGQPIAQATPLLIACFEGDSDVIKFLIENGADPNQTESEHHLSPLHVVCDSEYQGQTLRVSCFQFKVLVSFKCS
jgi:ankyrin repeat protein